MEIFAYLHIKLQPSVWNGPDVGPFPISSWFSTLGWGQFNNTFTSYGTVAHIDRVWFKPSKHFK